MQLFASLELPPAPRAALARWGAAAGAADPALRAVDAPALHLTLHFLGERPDAELDALRVAVAVVPDAPVPLTGTSALWFAPRRPHVLAAGFASPGGGLAALHAGLGRALAAAAPGWSPDVRPFRPHVTVARVRRGARPRQEAVAAPPRLRFDAAAVVLLESVLSPSGARYATLEHRALRTSA